MGQLKNKHSTPQRQASLKQDDLLVSTNVKILLSLLVGLVLALLSVFIVWQQFTGSLTGRAETIATTLVPAQVSSLIASDEKAAESEATIRSQLQRVRSVNSDVRFVYVMALNNNNEVYVLADSEPTSSTEYSPRGEIYGEASLGLKASFTDNKTFIESPISDASGSWVSVLSPIYDTSGRQIAMLGMDIPSTSYITFMSLAAVIPMLGSLLIGAVFVATDMIHRRRQESTRLRNELVSIAGHELRTPLTGIRWGEESLLKVKLTQKSKETVQTMLDSTLRLQESIEDILQLANLQSGRSNKLVITSTDMVTLVGGVFAMQKLPALQKDITLEFARDWPKQLIINCDERRMKRVFHNLISNAIKYTTQGMAVVVSYERVDGKHVISIKDHGIGIPAAEQAKVFGGFYRASNAIKQGVSGTGMGLFMSRNTIEQHGGKLWLSSTEGKGTTVFIQLP